MLVALVAKGEKAKGEGFKRHTGAVLVALESDSICRQDEKPSRFSGTAAVRLEAQTHTHTRRAIPVHIFGPRTPKKALPSSRAARRNETRSTQLTATIDNPAHGAGVLGEMVAQVEVVEVLEHVARHPADRPLGHHREDNVPQLGREMARSWSGEGRRERAEAQSKSGREGRE